MARIRSIKPTFWRDEKLTLLSREVRLTFIGIISAADDAGRLRGDLRLVKSDIYPLDDDVTKDILDAHLVELAKVGVITRYASAGSDYIAIPNWLKHQAINKPSPSFLPAPPEDSGNTPGADPGALREHSGSAPVALPVGREGNGREGNGMEPAAAASAREVDLVIVTNATTDHRLAEYIAERSTEQARADCGVIRKVWEHFAANDQTRRDAILAEMLSTPQGDKGPPQPWPQVITNATEYLVNNAAPNSRLFLGYLYRAPGDPAPQSNGKHGKRHRGEEQFAAGATSAAAAFDSLHGGRE